MAFLNTTQAEDVTSLVSVPFARGTPPWRRLGSGSMGRAGFSPLREGDTSVAQANSQSSGADCFSPLREGDTSVARRRARHTRHDPGFSPLREGDTSVADARRPSRPAFDTFQSPSRGGHLRGVSIGSSTDRMSL